MKNVLINILVISLVMIGLSSLASAEMATQEEALTVAKNWVALIIQKKGDWGGSKTVEVEGIQEFKRGNQIIGYFCRVKPKGFIVVSLHKMLPPVKAYSTISELDADSDKGLADLIKGGMERVLTRIEKAIGPIREARAADLESILEINYREAWEELGDGQVLMDEIGAPILLMNYQQGEVLTSSYWGQDQPYNNECPFMYCSRNPNGRAIAGCVAIAGATVMRYWNWPPYYNTVPFDWPNMPDILTYSSPQAQINAVAKLVYDVGTATKNFFQENGAPLFVTNWSRRTEPSIIAGYAYASDGFFNPGRPKNPEMDALVAKGATTHDLKKRKEIYRQIDQIVLKDCWFVPLLYQNVHLAAWNYVKGVSFGCDAKLRPQNLWISK